MDVVANLDSIIDFLNDLKGEEKLLLTEIRKLQELEKERHVAKENLLTINLKTQAEVLEKILQRYEFFQNDIDITGVRIKQIANNFLKQAQKAGLKDLVKEKKKNHIWQLWW